MKQLLLILTIFIGLTISCENHSEIKPDNSSTELSMDGGDTSQPLLNEQVRLYYNSDEDYGNTISRETTRTVSTGDKVSIVIQLNEDLQPISVYGKSDLFDGNQSLITDIRNGFMSNPAYSTECSTALTCCGEDRECNDKPSNWGVAGCWASCAIDVAVETVEEFIDDQGW